MCPPVNHKTHLTFRSSMYKKGGSRIGETVKFYWLMKTLIGGYFFLPWSLDKGCWVTLVVINGGICFWDLLEVQRPLGWVVLWLQRYRTSQLNITNYYQVYQELRNFENGFSHRLNKNLKDPGARTPLDPFKKKVFDALFFPVYKSIKNVCFWFQLTVNVNRGSFRTEHG